MRTKILLLPLLLSCHKDKDGGETQDSDSAHPEGLTYVHSDRERETSPDCSEAELAEQVHDDTTFALRLYQQLVATNQDDLFFSPHSVSVALAMAYAGARGDTEAGMEEALSLTLGQEGTHPAMNALDLALVGREDEAVDASQPFTLNLVNSVWAQEGADIETDWLDTLAMHYGAGAWTVDFAADPEAAREAINAEISEATEGMIPELLAEGTIDAGTPLVLTNAVLFKASWNTAFEEEDTVDGEFTTISGEAATVPMMRGTVSARYAEGEGYQAVELPYDGEMFSMLLLIPEADTFSSFEASLDVDAFEAIWGALDDQSVALTLPRWETRSDYSLVSALGNLGMSTAFGAAADFTGISGSLPLTIDDVLHQAVITVDEEGTEAAAATAVVFETGGIPEDPVTVSVDRPFLYAVLDRQTGAVLFLGRLLDPR